MARVKTFTNGGSLLPSDLDSIEDDYECAFGTYKHVLDGTIAIIAGQAGGSAAGTFPFAVSTVTEVGAATPAAASLALFYVDPGRYWSAASTSGINPRTVNYNVSATLIVASAIAPGTVTFTVGLYPVTAVAAGTPTLGSVVSGSTVPFASPAGNALAQGTSGDFTAPAAGYYSLGYNITAALAGSSLVQINAHVNVRQI